MTTTITEIETIEHLDFELACAGHRRGGVHYPCPREAEWAGIMTCCGHPTFFCEEHYIYFSGEWAEMNAKRARRLTCGNCKSVVLDTRTDIVWRKI